VTRQQAGTLARELEVQADNLRLTSAELVTALRSVSRHREAAQAAEAASIALSCARNLRSIALKVQAEVSPRAGLG
jgi:hypothetical protein